jgi:transcriptional regulator with XRE-family HTH domain
MPVYRSHQLPYAKLGLGGRIRERRQRKGLTLKALASKVDFSIAKLSQIENDLHVLDMAESVTLARVLGLDRRDLLPSELALPYQLTRSAERRSTPPTPVSFADLQTGESGTHWSSVWPLAEFFVGRQMDPILSTVGSVADEELRLCLHHDQEFAFVLVGRLQFQIRTPDGYVTESLDPGDCIYFRSSLPHAFRSLDSSPGEALHVYSGPSGPISARVGAVFPEPIASQRPGEGLQFERLLGERLRRLREAQGWSIDRVSELTGVRKHHLKQVEQGQVTPRMDALLSLARLFGRPLHEFVEEHGGPYLFVQRAAETAMIPSKQRRHINPNALWRTFKPLASGFPARTMYPYLNTLTARGIQPILHEHHGHEFVYVLEGHLKLRVFSDGKERQETLGTGDSCYIDATVPHAFLGEAHNPYADRLAQVVCVFWCPLGEGYLFEDS